jgi:hypothetical protein
VISIVVDDPAAQKVVDEGGRPLIDLCRKEAEAFDQYLRGCGIPLYAEGLARFEQEAIIGFLYQKFRGRLEPGGVAPQDLPGGEVPDGPA